MAGQLDLFAKPEYSINKPIRLITTFSGIGSQEMALRELGVNYEIYKAIEFDEFAIRSYNAIHRTNFPALDITKTHAEDLQIIDRDKFEYILFYSFPCTDLSVAGKQKGMSRDSGTRSGLLWEVERILKECGKELPHILIMENVTQVHSKNNMKDFSEWINFLNSLGYVSFWDDLNAKNYGIPQNRDRCFMVSILGDFDYQFPEEIPLKFVMKDVLEEEVDEKYFIKNERADELIKKLIDDGTIEKLGD